MAAAKVFRSSLRYAAFGRYSVQAVFSETHRHTVRSACADRESKWLRPECPEFRDSTFSQTPVTMTNLSRQIQTYRPGPAGAKILRNRVDDLGDLLAEGGVEIAHDGSSPGSTTTDKTDRARQPRLGKADQITFVDAEGFRDAKRDKPVGETRFRDLCDTSERL